MAVKERPEGDMSRGNVKDKKKKEEKKKDEEAEMNGDEQTFHTTVDNSRADQVEGKQCSKSKKSKRKRGSSAEASAGDRVVAREDKKRKKEHPVVLEESSQTENTSKGENGEIKKGKESNKSGPESTENASAGGGEADADGKNGKKKRKNKEGIRGMREKEMAAQSNNKGKRVSFAHSTEMLSIEGGDGEGIEGGKRKKENAAQSKNRRKRVSFADSAEVFSIQGGDGEEGGSSDKSKFVHGQRFTPEEDATLMEAIRDYVEDMDEDLPASDPGPSFTKLASFTGPSSSTSSCSSSEVEVRALASMARALYPLARAEGLRGLAAVLEKGSAGSGVAECCYGCAVELLRDEDEGIRLAAVRLVGLCVEKFAMREGLGGDGDQMDLIFLQLSSMARDMCAKVRVEAFNALAKMQTVSDGVLLQSLSKKVIKTDTGSAPGKKVPPKLIFPCAAGIFAHGIEDEFYQVRTAACKTLGALAKFSNQYAQKALDLLMDMMNDDTEAVRLQTLQTLLDMATYGHLSVQEKHMHMFLGILMDANVIVRSAAHKILGSVKLPKLQMFKSALDGLIACLEKNPEDQDIYGVLFSIGKNHGSFSANIAKHLAKEISMASDGELILDKPRIKALLTVSILAPSVDKEKELDIPTVIFSHAIPLLGSILCALGEDKQDSLLSHLFHRSGMPFWEKGLVSSEGRDSECSSVETVDETNSQTEKTGMPNNCLDEVVVMQSARLILETVQAAWTLRKSWSTRQVQSTLRTCKDEVNILAANSSGSTYACLSFVCDYLDAVQLIVEMWHFVQSENSYAFGPTSQDILLEKLDKSVRRMKCCYVGLNRELEVQVLEFALLAILFRLSELAICSELVLHKLHWIINHVDGLCVDGSCELSDFSKEVKKSFDASFTGGSVVNICTFLETFDLKPATDFGMLNATSAVLKVCDTDSENPSSYVRGLPVGISFDISLFNISGHDRIWLRMIAGQSVQHVFLDLSCFEGSDKVKSCSTVIPFYATPMACSFVLRVCLVIECPFGSIGDHQEGHGGARDCVVQLSDELAVYFVSADTEQRR